MYINAYEQLCSHFDELQLSYRKHDADNLLSFTVTGENGSYPGVAFVDAQLASVNVNAPIRVPEGCRKSVAEAVCRANYKLKAGRFDLDLSDGSLEFASSNFFFGVLEQDVIGHLLAGSMKTMDRFLPAFLSIVYANEEASSAIQRVRSEMT
jgi:hypothetical protein